MVPEKIKKILEKQHYSIVGKNSGVQICRWTKNSLNNKGVCWKEKFYGIKSHRCCQMSPAVMWCENQCLHCWRAIELNLGKELKEFDEPEKIIEGIINARKKLLIGFKSNKKTSEKKFKEALEPTLFTFSLSGEPTLYPKIGGMIKLLRKKGKITFLVTNGQNPDVLRKLEKNKSLPTQLTISMNAPNEELFKIWHRSLRKDAWKRFNKSLDVMKKLKGKTRRVIRLTLVKEGKEGKFAKITNMEQENIKEYAKLIKKAEPDFVHVKAFMSVGYSRERFGYDNMPFYEDIIKFAKELSKELGKDYKILGKHEFSRVVVLGKDKKMMKIKKV
jgi:tRNA wybutosine-synthesizing protein 1